MATQEQDLTLETYLNSATNPVHREEDWESISKFCDQVNKELEGPQYAIRLLAHKVQSPIEREALYSLTTLEACVKNCGKRFHQEIGKFRFLNEMIKVVSPKYLGSKTTEQVKKKVIELIYCWQKGLPHEPKIKEAYIMLKQQGIVKGDPDYMDKVSEDLPKPIPEEDKRATFEDEEKAKTLAKLLKSKNPEDLQAANRLIKNMVKQDTERMEKVSRRINELETIHANAKLLNEMVSHYNAQTSTDSDREMMKELYESLEKLRPKLFRLASETDEADTDGLNTILKANDEVSLTMSQYKKEVEGISENGQSGDSRAEFLKGKSQLVDFDQLQPSSHPPSYTPTTSTASSLLDDEMLSLGLKSPTATTGGSQDTTVPVSTTSSNPDNNLLSDLDQIFAASATQQNSVFPSNAFTMNQGVMNIGGVAPGGGGMNYGQPVAVGQSMSYTQPSLVSPVIPNVATQQMNQPPQTQGSVFDNKPFQNVSETQGKALEDLDVLGQTLMQQNLSQNTAKYTFNQTPKPVKVPLNQMAAGQATPATIPLIPTPPQASQPAVAMATHPPPISAVMGSGETTVSPRSTEVQPLTDVFVPLETIQPGTAPPVSAYDKNGLKVLIHVAKDRPREDVLVMVVTVLSTNSAPVKAFVFQAAVPKVMKVKLQPPSATDLPAFNPILPPAAITQVMLVANPQKEKIRLKYKVSFTLNDQACTDFGDIDTFTVQ